jgi:hypothetical protein
MAPDSESDFLGGYDAIGNSYIIPLKMMLAEVAGLAPEAAEVLGLFPQVALERFRRGLGLCFFRFYRSRSAFALPTERGLPVHTAADSPRP